VGEENLSSREVHNGNHRAVPAAYVWYSPGGELSVEQLADQYVDLLVAGLRPR
jgi:hypothetical protein